MIKEIKEKETWRKFLSVVEEKSFLQSWNWGEFQKMLGQKIWRLGLYKDNQLLAVSLVIKVSARRGKFLFLPHGPLFQSEKKSEILNELIKELRKIAKEEKCSFIRIATLWPRNEENRRIFRDLGLRKAPIHIHPELSWELKINLPEEELLANMRKTTRYLIKQAQKNKDLEIEISKNIKDVAVFNELYRKTVKRHHFTPFSLDYLKKEFLAFLPDNVLLFLAKYRGEYLASAMVIFWQGAAFYHQGASSQNLPKVPASYLLQWQAIKEAKKRGCQNYNFWGIADLPQNKDISKYRSHPWAGLSLFKMGFGGYEKKYLKTQDLALSFSYWFSYLVERIRKIKRGL